MEFDSFFGTLVDVQCFGVIISFKSVHNSEEWTMVSFYGTCQGPLRDDFANWLYNLTIPDDQNWLLLGDFNFIRSLDNRNRPGGMLMTFSCLMRSLDISAGLSCL